MRLLLFAVSLLFASVAIADELFLPLSGNVGGRPSTTELRIVNPSSASTAVSIELLSTGVTPMTRQLTLAAGETIEIADVLAELFGKPVSVGALRITSGPALRVTAMSRCAACGTTTTLPVLDQPIGEGHLAATVSSNDLGWESSIILVNPDSTPSNVTLLRRRGDEIIEGSVRVAARSTRVVPSRFLGELVSFRAPPRVVLFGYDVNARTGARVFTAPRSEAGQKRRRAVRFTSTLPPPVPQTVELTPSKDNTLFESGSGGLSNGKGIHVFAGTTGSGASRRALLAFDVASQIPPGSVITRVTLTLRLSQTISGAEPVTLHGVTTDWGEGTSNAGTTRDGTGDLSEQGDATWIHTFFPNSFWSNQGGDFIAVPDATTPVGSSGSFTWDSSAAMIARVQSWVDQPAANFGWLLIGNEEKSFSAKRFDSREASSASRPKLTVEFLR